MAPVAKRRTMAETGSTSSTGTGGRAAGPSTPRIRSSPRRVIRRVAESSTKRVYSLKISYRRGGGGGGGVYKGSRGDKGRSPARGPRDSPPRSHRSRGRPAAPAPDARARGP